MSDTAKPHMLPKTIESETRDNNTGILPVNMDSELKKKFTPRITGWDKSQDSFTEIQMEARIVEEPQQGEIYQEKP